MSLFVIVGGWPGSGKSTLAAALAAELGLPLLAKDEIKEALVEALGPPADVAASQRLGRAAVLAMLRVVPAILRLVVDYEPDRAVAARRVARRLLLGVATIESASHGSWTTDRATGAALLAAHHPQWTGVAARAMEMSAGPLATSPTCSPSPTG